MKKFNWFCLLLLIPAIYMWVTLDNTVNIEGNIIGITKDQVQAGKTGSRDRFRVAVKYTDRPSATIEVPFHYYLEAKVGDKISHQIKTLNPRYEGLFVIGGAILFSLSFVLGIIPFLWITFLIIKRSKFNYSDNS